MAGCVPVAVFKVRVCLCNITYVLCIHLVSGKNGTCGIYASCAHGECVEPVRTSPN